MKQKELILEYVKEFGSIVPAKMGGKEYKGQLFPSEIKRRCCEMRDAGILVSPETAKDGKFVKFFLAPQIKLPPAFAPKEKQEARLL